MSEPTTSQSVTITHSALTLASDAGGVDHHGRSRVGAEAF